MASQWRRSALHRHRGGPAQDLHLDLRQAVHTINPGAFWHPTLNGEPAPHPLVLDNPFLVTPYRTADGRWVMVSAVYPHLVAKWCRFLDVPPDSARVAAAVATWDALELEEAANAAGLPDLRRAHPAEWLAHEQGALLAAQPVIGLERIGDAPARDFGRPSDPSTASGSCRSRTPSPVRPSAGPSPSRARTSSAPPAPTTTSTNSSTPRRTSAPGAPTSISTPRAARSGRRRCWPRPTSWSTITGPARSSAAASIPEELAGRYPGLVFVSVSCYGPSGPWAGRGGFDMNGSAASGLMTIEGSRSEPRLPVTALLNDYITGYLGAVGASAALRQAGDRGRLVARDRQPDEDRHVVRLARARRPRARPGSDEEHSLREPDPYDAPSPLGEVHMLAPPVHFSATPPAWPDPILVPRGASPAEWRG